MAISYRVLGQVNPTANTLTTLYTVPAATSTIVSTIAICNQSANATAFSIAVRPQGAAVAASSYVNYNTPLAGNDTITLTIGMTLGNTDILSVNCFSSTVSVNVFGSEIS
jgi:glucose-6-phosphate dehydrogenase assembly protein OpcA